MRLFTFLALSACAGPQADAPETFTPGVYTGWFRMELTARLGPWQSETEGCDTGLLLIVQPDHEVAPIRGRVYCETPTLGGHLLDISGDLSPFPELLGALSSATRDDVWQGRFINEEHLFAELSGSVEQNGVTVDYTGAFSACLDPDAAPPGEPSPSGLMLFEEPAVEPSLLRSP